MDVSRPTEKPLVRAATHLAQGSYAEAAGAYRAVLSIDPNEHRAYLGLADCAVGRGAIDEAVEELVGMAQDFAERGLLPPAFSLMTKALAVDPARLELHIDVAELEASAGRLDMAIARLQNLARVYEAAGKDDEAVAVLEAAVAFDEMRGASEDEADPIEVEVDVDIEADVMETIEEAPAEVTQVAQAPTQQEPFAFAGPVPTDFAEDEIGAAQTTPANHQVRPPVQTGDTFVGPAPGPAPRAEQTIARVSARRRHGAPRWRASTIQMQSLEAAIPKPSAVPVEVAPGNTKALVHSPPRPPKAKVAPAPTPTKPTHTRELVFKPIEEVEPEAKPKRKLPIKKLPSPKKSATTRAKPPSRQRSSRPRPRRRPSRSPRASPRPRRRPSPRPKRSPNPRPRRHPKPSPLRARPSS